MKTEHLAQLCHEVHRTYCAMLGDAPQSSWKEAPEWQKWNAVKGVRLHRMNPDTGPGDSHDAWFKHMIAQGWSYGPVRDSDLKQHPCLVPYEQLTPEHRLKDHLFRAVVQAVVAWERETE